MSDSQSVAASCQWGCFEELEKGFWRLWEQYRDYLYRCCLKWMDGNAIDAEEALSLAMLKALEKLPDYAGKIKNLRGWLTSLTRNLCIDIHRGRRRKARQMESIEEVIVKGNEAVISSFDSPELGILRQELGHYIRRAIDSLSSRLRTPFILRYYHEISYQDIAQQLALSVDNVYKRIQQAREILQKRLSRYLSGLDDALLDSSESYKRGQSVVESEQFHPPNPPYQGGNRNWQLTSPLSKGGLRGVKQDLAAMPSPLSKGGLRGVKQDLVARCEESDETMISDSHTAIAMGCMGETINYQVTATCLETLPHKWYRSISPLGWS
jgi:RNA polymerase sigma-70 factor (ECF subfamily)